MLKTQLLTIFMTLSAIQVVTTSLMEPQLIELGWNRINADNLRVLDSPKPSLLIILDQGCSHCEALIDKMPSFLLPVFCKNGLHAVNLPEIRMYSSGHFITYTDDSSDVGHLSAWLTSRLSARLLAYPKGQYSQEMKEWYDGLAALYPDFCFAVFPNPEHRILITLHSSYSTTSTPLTPPPTFSPHPSPHLPAALSLLSPFPGSEASPVSLASLFMPSTISLVLFRASADDNSQSIFTQAAVDCIVQSKCSAERRWQWLAAAGGSKEDLVLRRLAGVKGKNEVRVIGFEGIGPGRVRKYRAPGSSIGEQVERLVRGIKSGELEPYLKTSNVETDGTFGVILAESETVFPEFTLFSGPFEYYDYCRQVVELSPIKLRVVDLFDLEDLDVEGGCFLLTENGLIEINDSDGVSEALGFLEPVGNSSEEPTRGQDSDFEAKTDL